MKVIPETRRAQYIRYLRFYFYRYETTKETVYLSPPIYDTTEPDMYDTAV
jgi:hypothetical protein